MITVATELETFQAQIGDIDPIERPFQNAKSAVLLRAIRALDTRFDPLILQLEIRDSVTNNYATIVTKLTEFERRMGPKEPVREGAFRAQTTGKSTKFHGKCFKCGKQGHRKQDCRSPTKAPETSPSTGPLPTPIGGKGLSPKPAEESSYAVEQSWTAVTVRSEPSTGSKDVLWMVDSGASRHMADSRILLTEYSALEEPITIRTTSGAYIEAIGQGTALLMVGPKGAECSTAHPSTGADLELQDRLDEMQPGSRVGHPPEHDNEG